MGRVPMTKRDNPRKLTDKPGSIRKANSARTAVVKPKFETTVIQQGTTTMTEGGTIPTRKA